jgi:hypothetical protein
MRRPGLLLPILAALACGRSVPPALAPDAVPLAVLACADTALETSSLVERLVDRHQGDPPGSRSVVLRNPPRARSTGMRFTVEPHQLVAEFSWPAPRQARNDIEAAQNTQASEMEGAGLTSIGIRLLLVVRAACAPDATGQPACTIVAQGRGGRCVLGT